ncbi:AMP-binding protein, partial [Nonomuraea sp. NPDC055795]
MTTPTEPPRPRDRFGCVHEWFERTAAARGEAVAVTAPGRRLTYGELDRRANRLARHLRTLGVGPEVPVGVCVERSAGLVVALLAVFKAGGAYLPLDPAYPDDRLMYMLADAGAAVLLGDDPKRGLGAEHHLGPGADLTAYPDTPLSPAARPGNLAYVMYTSGSTGAPKGVMIEHRAITRLFTATRDLFGFGPGEVWTLFHTYAFDFSVWEMWGALLHGGRLVVVPHDVARSPEAFHDLLHHERVTVLNQTPAAFRQLIRIDAQAPAQKSLAL